MSIDDLIEPSSVSGWDLALAVLVLVVTWIAFRLVRRITQAAVDRIGGLSVNTRSILVRAAKYLVLLLGIGVALTFLGAQLQPLITVALVVIAVVALSLRGVADNFGAGIILQTRHTIALGDDIESQGFRGVVTELNGRSVVIKTSAGTAVHLPNAALLSTPLINYSEYGSERSALEVALIAPGDMDAVTSSLGQMVTEVDGVLNSPPPTTLVHAVDGDRVTFSIRFWHAPTLSSTTRSAVAAAMGEHFRQAGVGVVISHAEQGRSNPE